MTRKLEYYGCKTGSKPLVVDKSLLKVAELIVKAPSPTTLKDASTFSKTKAQEVLNNLGITIHAVPYLSLEDLKSIYDTYNKSTLPASSLIESLNSKITLISPYELPLVFISGHEMIGQISKNMLVVDNKKFMEEQPISFSKIELGFKTNNILTATYIHELSHSQFEHKKGSFTNYQNKEVIPIFMEKVAIKELDKSGLLLKESEYKRFAYLKDKILALTARKQTPAEALDNSMLIISTLQAENLFDKYQQGNIKEKQKILKSINKVFTGTTTVENMLAENNVSSANSQNLMLIRKHLTYKK